MRTYNLLGTLLTEIYWNHDSQDFNKLENTAENIYKILGYNEENARKASKLLKECYQLADQAEAEQIKGEFNKEKSIYCQIFRKFRYIEKIFNRKRSIARFQIKWWVSFRHKKLVNAAYYLFRQHLTPFGVRGWRYALIITYYIIRVGLGHNKKDKNITCEYAGKYWYKILTLLHKENYPFIG